MVHDPHQSREPRSGQARSQDAEGGDRVAKALARAGVGSRRDVEKMIAEGRVALNGHVLTTPAVKVEPNDILTVDGQVVNEPEPTRLFRYNKPVGLVTTHKDPQDRPTVFAALPEGLPRLISVGRLDLNTEGLLLLTNDGELARALELPAAGVQRRYRARAHGRITQERLDKLKDGITVEGVRYGSIDAKLDKAKEGPQGANVWITVTLAEGKNREVRRVLEAVGLKVNRLIRLSYGPFALGTLGHGEIEEVGPRVIREQLAEFIAPENMPKGDRPLFKAQTKPGASRRAQAEPEAPRHGTDLTFRRGRTADGEAPAGRRGAQRPTRPGGKPGGRPAAGDKRPRSAAEGGPAKPKKEYKAGWAKPKPKASGKPGPTKKPGGASGSRRPKPRG